MATPGELDKDNSNTTPTCRLLRSGVSRASLLRPDFQMSSGGINWVNLPTGDDLNCGPPMDAIFACMPFQGNWVSP